MTSSMDHAPVPLLDHISHWSEPAQQALWRCRTLFHLIADENGLGDLDEALKWGQPAWRPKRPRTGSTLRMGWSEVTPDQLALYVDCKTDLAQRMYSLYPDLPRNDGRRALAISLAQAFPEQAMAHLAEMTFSYHLKKRASASMS